MNEPQHETRDVLLGLLLPSAIHLIAFVALWWGWTLVARVMPPVGVFVIDWRYGIMPGVGVFIIDALVHCLLVLPAAFVAWRRGRSGIAKGLLMGFALGFGPLPWLCVSRAMYLP